MTFRWLMIAATALVGMYPSYPAYPAYPAYPSYLVCPRCSWHPPGGGHIVDVRTVDDLERASTAARPGDTLLLADGDYRLRRTITIAVPDVTVRGRSGDPARVILRGDGMTRDEVGTAIAIAAAGVTVADLTIRDVRWHAVQVRGEAGASRFMLHNARLQDTGQQLLKVSVSSKPVYADDGTIACSAFEYTDHAPSTYTNGVDIIAGRGWTIRDSRFTRIRGPEADGWRAGPAILAWGAAAATIVERNVIVDSARGIALGLGARAFDHPRGGERLLDHAGGVIRQNVVVNRHPWADEGIEANAAAGVRIEHNTVVVDGRNPWSIGIRFAVAAATVRNNLTSQPIVERTGGRAVLHGNVAGARPEWFVDLAAFDLHLTPHAAAIDAGVAIDGMATDFDRQPRMTGRSPDAGAFEYEDPRVPADANRMVSFVVPVRNDAARLDRCLRSIRTSEYPAELVEIVVADNGSTDRSAEVGRSHGAVVLDLPGLRLGALRNRAAAAARGDVIAFVDADHEIVPGWIPAAVSSLSDPAVAAVGAACFPPQPATWVQRLYDRLRPHPSRAERVDWLGSGNMAVTRAAFEAAGGFDVALETCEDVDLCRKIRARGDAIVADPRLRNIHYGDPGTLGRVFFGELWRGRDNIRVSLRAPRSWRTLISAAMPVAHLVLIIAAIVAALTFSRTGLVAAAAAILLVTASFSLRASRMATRPGEWPAAFSVAAAYELGRALALTGWSPYRLRRKEASADA